MTGLVSIVTPTRPDRMGVLLERCIPSVARLDWPGEVEHVIVSDRNPELRQLVRTAHDWPEWTRLVEINDTWRDGTREKSVGAVPWHVGSLLALGEWVGFLGDDDEYLPEHVTQHIAAMQQTGSDFSVSPVQFVIRGQPWMVIGDATFAHGHLDAIGIMCRAETLRAASWTATGEDAADWRLVRDWQQAGKRGVFAAGPPTALHHDGWAAAMSR